MFISAQSTFHEGEMVRYKKFQLIACMVVACTFAVEHGRVKKDLFLETAHPYHTFAAIPAAYSSVYRYDYPAHYIAGVHPLII
ncbi:unnamed protein product [Nesidiocoris tenuis]|uniref:Uncharacterized protein n=1 Tax=Nesidiocoris tenuis TaxID=355587 RepID=A0A6H5HVD0_9HEMI|nr:unnamed protein product [Nesidiocoris tenuis]